MRKYNLPKQFRKDWLEALESGVFKQTTNALHKNGTFCCLGVAAIKLGINPKNMNACGMPRHLNSEFVERFPKCLLGTVLGNSFAGKLAEMNDNEKSFKEIAKYIRKHTKGV